MNTAKGHLSFHDSTAQSRRRANAKKAPAVHACTVCGKLFHGRKRATCGPECLHKLREETRAETMAKRREKQTRQIEPMSGWGYTSE